MVDQTLDNVLSEPPLRDQTTKVDFEVHDYHDALVQTFAANTPPASLLVPP